MFAPSHHPVAPISLDHAQTAGRPCPRNAPGYPVVQAQEWCFCWNQLEPAAETPELLAGLGWHSVTSQTAPANPAPAAGPARDGNDHHAIMHHHDWLRLDLVSPIEFVRRWDWPCSRGVHADYGLCICCQMNELPRPRTNLASFAQSSGQTAGCLTSG